MSDYDTAHIETDILKLAAQAQYIFIVGDAEVAAYLVFLNVVGADNHDNFSLVAQLQEHLQLAVRLETGKHATGVVVVKEFAAKLEVKFVSEFGNAFLDAFRLNLEVFLVVKSCFHMCKVTARAVCSKAICQKNALVGWLNCVARCAEGCDKLFGFGKGVAFAYIQELQPCLGGAVDVNLVAVVEVEIHDGELLGIVVHEWEQLG